jgi:hypothetical protein
MAELIYALEKSPKVVEMVISISHGACAVLVVLIVCWLLVSVARACN